MPACVTTGSWLPCSTPTQQSTFESRSEFCFYSAAAADCVSAGNVAVSHSQLLSACMCARAKHASADVSQLCKLRAHSVLPPAKFRVQFTMILTLLFPIFLPHFYAKLTENQTKCLMLDGLSNGNVSRFHLNQPLMERWLQSTVC